MAFSALSSTAHLVSQSTQNHLDAEVASITQVGNRVRVGLASSQPLSAEVTLSSSRRLELRPGARVTAAWKAAATRLVEY